MKTDDIVTLAVYANASSLAYVFYLNDSIPFVYDRYDDTSKTKEKSIKKLLELIDNYQPHQVIANCFSTKHNKKATIVFDLLRTECGRRGCPFVQYDRTEIAKVFEVICEAKNKHDMAKYVASYFNYLRLEDFLPQKRKYPNHENPYQIVFDAFSLVVTHLYLNGGS